MAAILAGEIDEVQTAVFLIALRMKRESAEECSGVFDALQGCVEQQGVAVDELFYLVDPFDGYVRTATVTPFVPCVLAACGLPTLMHGVHSVGPKHGVTAHQVYHLAGLNPLSSAAQAARQIERIGWGYLDQQVYAPQVHAMCELRDRIVKRTVVTTIERVLMPLSAARATHLVLGYVHRAYPQIYSHVAAQAGYASSLLIKGVEGGIAPALNKPLRRFMLKYPDDNDISGRKQVTDNPVFSDSEVPVPPLKGDSKAAAEYCLKQGLQALDGRQGAARDSLCWAAGQILEAHGRVTNLRAAVEKVQNCLDNGSAKACFYAYKPKE